MSNAKGIRDRLRKEHQKQQGAPDAPSAPSVPAPPPATTDFPRFFDTHIGEDITTYVQFDEQLGTGSFSSVFGGTVKASGAQVAVKRVEKTNINARNDALKNEVLLLLQVRHRNIVQLYDIFEDRTYVYLVMERMVGGELFTRIQKVFPRGYPEPTAARLIAHVVTAIQHLHSMNVVHRDLKPENLLYVSSSNQEELKLCDFGMAKVWREDLVLKTACGSPNYVAPEVLMQSPSGYTPAVDMWSVGVITYVVLSGYCPFHHKCNATLRELITSGEYEFHETHWGKISPQAKDFIAQLLIVNSTRRMTATAALQHPWLREHTVSRQTVPDTRQ